MIVALCLVITGSAIVAGVAAWSARRMRRAVARYCHEVRATLATACIALEAAPPGARPSGVGRVGLGEMQRAVRLVRSLEETAQRGAAGTARYAYRCATERSRRRRRSGEFSPRAETVRVTHMWMLAARRVGRAVSLTWDADDRDVAGSADLFVQALSNLLANALRHGAGEVTVRAESTSSHLRLSVTDEGPGLRQPLAKLARRCGSQAHGHGLPVCDRAVRALGGTLASAPTPYDARFVIELPLAVDLLHDESNDWFRAAVAANEQVSRRRESRVIPFRPSAGPARGPRA